MQNASWLRYGKFRMAYAEVGGGGDSPYTEHIRSKMNSQIPIIALTADVTTADVEKCKAVGMNDYVSKPVDEKLLYSKIIKYIKKPIE